MNKKSTWTKEQLDAITVEAGSILVSSAAGSGKTSVLVQRVIRKITDKKNPIDVNKLLIVTFTNAAAQEMKSRISQKLSELIEQEPDNINLQRQKILLKCTQIGTIHSFCNNIIKENFFKLGISPSFKISDSSDLLDLMHKALENTLDFFFEQENPIFYDVLDLFGNEKNNTEIFKNIILDIYKFTESIAFPQKWFSDILNMYKKRTNGNNVWQEYILEFSRDKINLVLINILESIEIIKSTKELEEKYLTFFEEDLNNIQNIKETLNTGTWDDIVKQISNFNFTRLKSFKIKDSIYEKEIMISKRSEAKNIIEKLKNCLCWSQSEIQTVVKEIYPKIELIFNIVSYFDQELTKIKFQKNILSFSDLEHFCLKLLADENRQKSDIARSISEQFDEIMIDEYQDINEVQDAIFRLVSRDEQNIFMVGDVKQSIYGFRQSRPEIFLDKKNKYKTYNEDCKEKAKIILSKNFRSDKEVINSINFIFENLMSKKIGDIDYNNEERLVFGYDEIKTNQDPNTNCFNIKLIDTSEINDKELEDIFEAQEIAKTIQELVSNKKYNYKDICILLRNTKNHINIYKRELESFGIPVLSENTEEFLSTAEILTITSILQFVNNPVDDVSLAATMLNPLFGFTLEELTDIRVASRELPMYFALKKYIDSDKNSQKIQDFIKKIENYRQISVNSSCDELIDYIYQDTNILKIFYNLPNGKLKKANLLLFLDYARKFSKDAQKSLSEFIEYIKSIQSKKSDLPCATIQEEAENAVKIMSIHKSKGLEFPVCIIAGTSSKFVQNTDSVLLHPKFGIGMKLRSEKLNFVYDNIIRKSISMALNHENVSEELRVLYVALTRAKNMVYFTANIKNINKFIEKVLYFQNRNLISEHDIESAGSFWDWLFLCISKSSVKKELCEALNLDQKETNTNLNILDKLNWKIDIVKPNNNIINKKIEENDIICQNNAKKSEYVYPFENKINLPVKTTASQISQKNIWRDNIATEYPDFMLKKSISSAARGTLLHKFMCCCDLKKLSKNLDLEIKRLVKLNFFSIEEIKFLDKSYIKNFVNSELYTRIINSPEILREYKFSVKVPVKNISCDFNYSNEIIVQGAIDCLFLENNNYVIIDYKTDRITNKTDFINKYFVQLDIYKQAIEQIKNINISELGIYSFFNSEYYKL